MELFSNILVPLIILYIVIYGKSKNIDIYDSFVVGVLVIKFLLNYLQKGSFKVFAIYRVILGLFVIGLCISRLHM